MNDLELFWATVTVPYENYIRGTRVKLPRTRRNSELAASGYLRFDPVLTEALRPSVQVKKLRKQVIPRGQG